MDKVQHFEIPADDTERAQKFYSGVFGWKISKAGEMPYWIINTVETDDKMMPKESGAINGGMLQRDNKDDPSGTKPVIVITVKDCDAYCKKVEEANGKVVLPPRKVGDMGIYARFKDPEGNVMGLWQPLKWEP